MGFNLQNVKNGKDAIALCSNTTLDLVLMDIGLPDISGYDAIRQILAINPNLKIIAQTAYAGDQDRTKALEAGCVDYISKPIKANNLKDLLYKYV